MTDKDFITSLNDTLHWLLSMKEVIGNGLLAATLSTCATTGIKTSAIDYENSYIEADKVLTNYQHYKDCVEGFDQKPLPTMRILSNEADQMDIIESYCDYVNDLIDYIHDMKTECHPPMDISLPIYRNR